MGQGYASPRFAGVQHSEALCGNDRTTMLWTPATATATGGTNTMSDTGKHEAFGRAIKIKRLLYLVDAATDAGDATTSKVDILLYKGTAVQSTLTVTTEAALAICTSSALDVSVAATDYIRIYSHSVQTATDKYAATGVLKVSYEEEFVNA